MKITRYLLRRLLFVVPQLVGVTLITFLLVQLIPGDPARLMLGPLASEETIKLLRDHLGLNRSLPEQYVPAFGEIRPRDAEIVTEETGS